MAVRRLAARDLAATIGYSAAPGESPRAVADAHVAAFEALGPEDADCYVSIKLSALAFDATAFGSIAAAAGRAGRRLHVDAVAPEAVEPTWRLLEDATGAVTLGTTLPGRWRRSVDDTARVAELGLAVRVVKGQWPDPSGEDLDAKAGFLEVADRLVDHPATVALATHDVTLLAEALRWLAGRPAPTEVELFYGLPFRRAALVAREAGVPVRMYVPYGDAGAPYSRDAAARPAAAWWLAQDLLLGEDKTWRSIRRTPLS